ncbi:DUF2510 domain-containing protein [Streptomyces canus]|jgi:hypothetical protein|uniref:DUF2510 domain-containing protein n=1 Tax=Streptomyces canus TaxID=58343 RepID=UPI00371FB7E6
MSRTLPPGWYPDPNAPHLERWWDGTAWTDHRRAPEGPGPPRSAGGASGRAKAVALTTSGVVLVAAIVSGAFALARDGGDDVVADTAPTAATLPPSPASPAPSRLDDELDGISLPLPDGWVPAKYVTRDNVVMRWRVKTARGSGVGAAHQGVHKAALARSCDRPLTGLRCPGLFGLAWSCDLGHRVRRQRAGPLLHQRMVQGLPVSFGRTHTARS